MEALQALSKATFFRRQLGEAFVVWLVGMKQSEVNRFLALEPDWQRCPDR